MWSSLIGQHRAKDNLQRALVGGRVAHAYCFWGPAGVGKEAAALELARCLNCEHPKVSEASYEACGECKSCKQCEHLQHPNLRLVFALPAGKGSGADDDSPIGRFNDDQLAELQEHMQLKAEQPYHSIRLNGATQIRIASVRDIKKSVQMSQAQRGHRVVILCDAERMTTEAANAFLKTLEEPGSGVTFILCSSRKEQLPQTILSRCQQIQFDSLSDADIRQALMDREELSEQQARLCASLAQGSYSQALSVMSSDTQSQRNEVVNLLRAAMRGGNYRSDILSSLDELTADADRSDVEQMLNVLLLWLRDAMMVQFGAEMESIINIDQYEILSKFVAAYPGRDYAAAITLIEEAIRNIRGNGQIHLNLVSLMLGLRTVFLGT